MFWTYSKAHRGDFDRLNELFTEMLRTIYRTDRAEGYAPGDLDRFFCGGEDWVCTAIEDGRIVGFLSMEVHRGEADFLYLDDFSVTAACRGRGIGTALIRRAEAYAEERNIPALRLHVEKSNADALRLYQRLEYRLLEDQGGRYLLEKGL